MLSWQTEQSIQTSLGRIGIPGHCSACYNIVKSCCGRVSSSFPYEEYKVASVHFLRCKYLYRHEW